MVTATVVAATIAWSMGLSALTAAAAVTPGTLIKASLPTVYYLGSDNKRYVFPNEKAYKTWYADFSSVQTITDAELAALPLGGNVTYRPGVRMVKITTDPKVYAVSKGGVIRWVKTEAVAIALYGSNWNKMIDDVSDAFFTNYTVGADINTASDYVPATETANSSSINVDKNLATGSTTVSGTLTAMLSASQPMGGTLPGGATGVNMVKVDVRNGGSTVAVIDSMVIRRTGIGASTDFVNVYAYEGVNRLTTGRTINSTTNEATFSGLALSLNAGETKTLWISADMDATPTAGNENAISVVSINSGSTVAAGLPVSGPTYRLAGTTVGSVTIDESSSSLSAVTAGEMGSKVADFKLNVGTSEDITFNRVGLYYSGTAARTDVTNLVLKQAGLTIASVAGINSKDQAVFVLSNPITLEKGANRIFEVYADVAGGVRSTENVKFYLDEASDLSAVGKTYGYGVTVTNSYAGVTVSVEAGQLTATFNGPAAKTVASDSDGVELFNYTLVAQNNLEVRETKLDFTGTTNTADLDNLKIVDAATGALIAGPIDVDATTETFTEVYNLTAGVARTFKVVSDIASGAAADESIKVTLGVTNLFSADKVRNLDNNTYVAVTEMVPSGVIAGNTHTVQTAGLTVSVASNPVSQTFIQGSQGVSVLGINLKSGDATDTKVTSIKVTGYVDADTSGTFTKGTDATATVSDIVLTAGLWNGSTQVGQTKSPTTGTGGEMTFDNLNLTIPKGQSVTLLLKANLASSIATVVASSDRVKFDVTANGDIVATDADGNSLVAGSTLTGAPINTTTADTGIRMTVASAGTLTVALAADDTESEAGLVVGGGSNVVLGKYKFSAANEELKLTKVRFTTAYSAGVSSLALYDGATLVGAPVGVDGSGNADFTGLNFVIPKDGSKTLIVKGNLNTVGSSGSVTASNLVLTMEASSTGSTFEARGTSAGSSTLIQSVNSSVDITANAKIVRKSKPTVTLAALPSTTLTDGDKTVLRFTVAADAAGDVALYRISADVIASDASGSNLTVATISGNSSIREVGGDYIAGTATLASSVLTSTFTNEQVVAAGTSKTYEIVLTIGVSETNDSIVTKLKEESDTTPDAAYAANTITAVTANERFIWSDMSSAAHALTTEDWTNGYKVKTLPTDSSTISR